MNDLRQAAEMALEFMSWLTSDDHSIRPHKAPDIIKALRQALDKPTWHCPLKKPDCNENCGSYGCGN